MNWIGLRTKHNHLPQSGKFVALRQKIANNDTPFVIKSCQVDLNQGHVSHIERLILRKFRTNGVQIVVRFFDGQYFCSAKASVRDMWLVDKHWCSSPESRKSCCGLNADPLLHYKSWGTRYGSRKLMFMSCQTKLETEVWNSIRHARWGCRHEDRMWNHSVLQTKVKKCFLK